MHSVFLAEWNIFHCTLFPMLPMTRGSLHLNQTQVRDHHANQREAADKLSLIHI